MKGYKYICDYFNFNNYLKYRNKTESSEIVLSTELDFAAGTYDKEDCKGIYFCRTQEDLFHWIDELFAWETDIGAIEILEVTSIGEVSERIYEDGRIAYVTDKAYVRILGDKEIIDSINDLCDRYLS